MEATEANLGANEHEARVSKVLYRFAWFVEFCAVGTGLAITIMVAMTTFESNSQFANAGSAANYVNVVIAALPFFLASVIELAKIPAAQAMYLTRNIKWKILFAITLLFLAVVTFETAINGFERNFTNISFQVTQLKDQREKVVGTRDELVRQIEEDSKITLEEVLDENRQRKQALDVKRDADIESLKAKYAGLSEAQANINDDIDRLREELTNLEGERREGERSQREIQERNRQQANNEAQKKYEQLADSVKTEEAKLLKMTESYDQKYLDAGYWEKGRLKRAFDKDSAAQQIRIDEARAQLNAFSLTESSQGSISKFNDVTSKLKSEFDIREQELKSRINELVARRDQTQDSEEALRREADREALEQRYREDSDRLQLDADKQVAEYQSIDVRKSENQVKLRDVEDELISLNGSINSAAKDNQVYRLAKLFSDGVTIAEVPEEKINLIAKIWFGSLASIIAFTGILLALASEVVKRQVITPQREQSRGVASALASLSLSINRFVRARPRVEYRTEVKEVVKEIPVEKVVVQEVIKEVIKKEVVHVPVYTSNKEVLKRQDENDG